jgi:hypothetical protein
MRELVECKCNDEFCKKWVFWPLITVLNLIVESFFWLLFCFFVLSGRFKALLPCRHQKEERCLTVCVVKRLQQRVFGCHALDEAVQTHYKEWLSTLPRVYSVQYPTRLMPTAKTGSLSPPKRVWKVNPCGFVGPVVLSHHTLGLVQNFGVHPRRFRCRLNRRFNHSRQTVDILKIFLEHTAHLPP